MKTWGGYVKKQAKRVYKAAKKRYVSKAGNFKLAKLTKDVAYLGSMLNAEKKRVITAYSPTILGQVRVNNQGYYAVDLTPSINEGVGYQNRTGSSVKLHSMFLSGIISQQSGADQRVKFKWYIFQVKGDTSTSAYTFVDNIVQTNPFIGAGNVVRDYNSPFNPDYFGTYKIIRSGKWSLSSSQYASAPLAQIPIKILHKFNRGAGHHIRYSADTNTVVDGQIIFAVFPDNGNCDPVSPSTLSNVIVTAAASGDNIVMQTQIYYYDN